MFHFDNKLNVNKINVEKNQGYKKKWRQNSRKHTC